MFYKDAFSERRLAPFFMLPEIKTTFNTDVKPNIIKFKQSTTESFSNLDLEIVFNLIKKSTLHIN